MFNTASFTDSSTPAACWAECRARRSEGFLPEMTVTALSDRSLCIINQCEFGMETYVVKKGLSQIQEQSNRWWHGPCCDTGGALLSAWYFNFRAVSSYLSYCFTFPISVLLLQSLLVRIAVFLMWSSWVGYEWMKRNANRRTGSG